MKYKYLLIDLDNTILDFDATEHSALCQAFVELFQRELTKEEVAEYSRINQGYWKLLEKREVTKPELKERRFRDFLSYLGLVWDGDMEMINAVYMTNLGNTIFVMPGAEEVIRRLAERYRLFIITNGTTSVQESRMRLLQFADCFEQVFISDEIGYNKPAPQFFDAVVAVTGEHDPGKYLIIGDSLSSDIAFGKNIGSDTCRYYYRQKGEKGEATYTVTSWSEIAELLEV